MPLEACGRRASCRDAATRIFEKLSYEFWQWVPAVDQMMWTACEVSQVDRHRVDSHVSVERRMNFAKVNRAISDASSFSVGGTNHLAGTEAPASD